MEPSDHYSVARTEYLHYSFSVGGESALSNRLRHYTPYVAYKSSGVEWLGEIPAHWNVRRLKNSAPIRTSRFGSKPEEATYVGLEHIQPWTGQLILGNQPDSVDSTVTSFDAGDVLFGKLRPYLAKSARPDFSGVATSEILSLRPLSDCLQSYLMYCLLNEAYIRWIDVFTYGARMPRISPDQVGNSLMPLPPMAEQQAIAAFLDRETAKIDALVTKKERLIELLQEKRTALISRAVSKGLDPNAPLKDSGVEWLGEIPAHWEVRKLKTIVPDITVGIVVTPAKYYVDQGVPCLRSLNIAQGRISTEDLVFISQKANQLHEKSQIFAGDVVVVRTGRAGVAVVVPPELDGANCIDLLIVRRSEHLNPEFYYYVMNSQVVSLQVSLDSVGAIQEHYNTSTLGNLLIPCIPYNEQRAIAAYLNRETMKIDSLVSRVREAMGQLKELRTALISAAVTGRIDVREEVA